MHLVNFCIDFTYWKSFSISKIYKNSLLYGKFSVMFKSILKFVSSTRDYNDWDYLNMNIRNGIFDNDYVNG